MLKFAIICFVIAFAILLYLALDHSKEARVKRIEKAKMAADTINRRIVRPLSVSITSAAKEEKVQKVEKRYEKAGIKISYAANVLICIVVAVVLFLICWKGIGNTYLAVVAGVIGLLLPSIALGYLANRRAEKLDDQIGTWMRMSINRYKTTLSFREAFDLVLPEFAGEEPIYSELVKTSIQLSRNEPMADALKNLADRCGSKYLNLFAKYYETAAEQGTPTAMNNVLEQAVKQYDEHIRLQKENKRQLSELTLEAYILWVIVPLVVVYAANTNADYIDFMTKTRMGQIGSACLLGVWILIFWVITFKLGAPLDD